MKQGIISKIMSDYGETEELNILCSFNYDGQNYLLAIDENNYYVCRKIKYSPWTGICIGTNPVDKEVVRIGNILLRKADSNKEFYRFEAEHYVISEEQGKIRFRKYRKLNLLDRGINFIPILTRLLVAELFALAYGFICVHTAEIAVAANVFNIASRSKLIAVTYLIQVLGALFLFLVRRSDRDWSDLYFNAIIPYNTIALVGLFRVNKEIRVTVISIVVASFLLWILPKVIQAIKARKKTQKIRHWKTALHRCYAPFVICLCVVYVAVHFLGVSVYTYSSNKTENYDIQSIESFNSVRDSLQSEKWETYSNQEKLDILQVICDYECKNSLGCDSPKVVAGHPERDTIYGSYSSQTKTITISVDHLANDPAEDVLDTLLHEARHAYQHAAVNALNAIEKDLSEEAKALSCFKTIKAYRDNFENYISGSKDYYSYYDQDVESDSRSWAEWRVMSEYYYYVHPVLDEEQSGSAEKVVE